MKRKLFNMTGALAVVLLVLGLVLAGCETSTYGESDNFSENDLNVPIKITIMNVSSGAYAKNITFASVRCKVSNNWEGRGIGTDTLACGPGEQVVFPSFKVSEGINGFDFEVDVGFWYDGSEVLHAHYVYVGYFYSNNPNPPPSDITLYFQKDTTSSYGYDYELVVR